MHRLYFSGLPVRLHTAVSQDQIRALTVWYSNLVRSEKCGHVVHESLNFFFRISNFINCSENKKYIRSPTD